MKSLIALLILSATPQVFAANPSSELETLVKSNLKAIEVSGAQELHVATLTLQKSSIKCLAIDSFDVGLVGTCLVIGDLDYPNSSSAFSISVGDKEEGSMERSFSVTRLTSEI